MSDNRRVVTVGETMAMFRSSEPGAIHSGNVFQWGFGGSESNVAIALSRLKVPVSWVSAVGNDSFGAEMCRTLSSEGVEVLAHTNAFRPTGVMVKTNEKFGNPIVNYYRGGSAASALTVDQKMEDVLRNARWLHLTGIFPALSDCSLEATKILVDLAVEGDVPFSFDINYRPQLWSKEAARSTLLGIVSEASIVFGGVEELEILVGQHRSVPDLMKAVADIGPVEVVAKQAHEGASCLAGAGVYSTPVHPVTVVDTVGAGDAFVAGYLSQRLAGRTPQKSLLRGAICGALACTEAGDWEGAPQLEDVIALEKGVLV